MPPRAQRAGEGPCLVPEELALDAAVSGMAAQLTRHERLVGAVAGDCGWRARSNPLPVPVSPSSSTEMSRSSTRLKTSTLLHHRRIGGSRHLSEPLRLQRRAAVRIRRHGDLRAAGSSTGACTVANQRLPRVLVLRGSARYPRCDAMRISVARLVSEHLLDALTAHEFVRASCPRRVSARRDSRP